VSDQQGRAEAVSDLRRRVFGSSEPGVHPDIVAAVESEREQLGDEQDRTSDPADKLWDVALGDKDVADRVAERAKRARRRRAKLVALLKRHWWKVPALVALLRFLVALRRERTR